jgi:hypothetical protein
MGATWTHRTLRDMHGGLTLTAAAAILEMAGGADRNNFSITMAIAFFAVSLPINLYGWIILNDEFVVDEKHAAAYSASMPGIGFLCVGALCVFGGMYFIISYFSKTASVVVMITLAGLSHYEVRIRLPRYRALDIWRSHDTREARLAAWKAEMGKGDEEFDRIIERLRKKGRLSSEANSVPDIES